MDLPYRPEVESSGKRNSGSTCILPRRQTVAHVSTYCVQLPIVHNLSTNTYAIYQFDKSYAV
jgi:hypothetical protein